MDTKQKALELLHKWLNERKVPQIKLGMVEELEALIDKVLEESQLNDVARKMIAKHEDLEKVEETSE